MDNIHFNDALIKKGTIQSNQSFMVLFENYVSTNVKFDYERDAVKYMMEHYINGNKPIDYVISQDKINTPYTYALTFKLDSPECSFFITAKDKIQDGQLYDFLAVFDIKVELY